MSNQKILLKSVRLNASLGWEWTMLTYSVCVLVYVFFASNTNRSNPLSYNKNPLKNFVRFILRNYIFIVIDDLFQKEGGQTFFRSGVDLLKRQNIFGRDHTNQQISLIFKKKIFKNAILWICTFFFSLHILLYNAVQPTLFLCSLKKKKSFFYSH